MRGYMILKQLKIAGFKSFVDPVSIPLQSSFVGIVGPNGCGKSNIMDAVRWVMGESSAKNLRGEAMTDVIFNGSSQRKAVGQASVELIFDNRLGFIGGQYSAYQEISIKRIVTRDGDSTYFLNGTRCRRRDVTDIFLGTGVGPRSYALIGQGTISRIIEARPEELRAYLEEAAGVSRYKERRRETIQRIATTRDNLLRVQDIRDELGKQLQRLEQQAKAATQYQILRIEEQRLKAEVIVLKWQGYQTELECIAQQLRDNTLILSQYEADAAEAQQHFMDADQKWNLANQNLQTEQAHFYQCNQEIQQIESQISHQQRERERLLTEQKRLEQESLQLKQQLLHDQQIYEQRQSDYATLQEQLIARKERCDTQKQKVAELREKQQVFQQQVNEKKLALERQTHQRALAESEANHLQNQIAIIKRRIDAIFEQQAILKQQLEAFQNKQDNAQLVPLEENVATLSAAFEKTKQAQVNWTEERQGLFQQSERDKAALYQLTLQVGSLEAWIAQALGKQDNQTVSTEAHPDFLVAQLAEKMQVEPDWRPVCEAILGQLLQSWIIEDFSPEKQKQLAQTHKVGVFSRAQSLSAETKFGNKSRLIDKINGELPAYMIDWGSIYLANSLDEACHLVTKLSPQESVITQDGHWLGDGWIQNFNCDAVEATSILKRQDALYEARQEQQKVERAVADGAQQLQMWDHKIAANQQELLLIQTDLLTAQDALKSYQQQQAIYSQQVIESNLKYQQVIEEHQQFTENLQDLLYQLDTNGQQQQTIQTVQQGIQEEVTRLEQTYADALGFLEPELEALDADCLILEDLQRQEAQLSSQIEQMQIHLQRDGAREIAMHARLEGVMQSVAALLNPEQDMQPMLAQKLALHQQLEQALQNNKQQLADIKQQRDQFAAKQQTLAQSIVSQQTYIQRMQLDQQTLLVKSETILEGMPVLNHTVSDIQAQLSTELSITGLETQLKQITHKIQQLGAINLAAIEEYQAESERKQYLDQQHDDLTKALALLESAIETMDNETRQRFSAMFDDVNQRFQQLFPHVFGGGKAYLQLTDNNLLEAGVMVMANPPGKKNSTIHLLSGGEKALTALALIFAIFQQNPSPFCMLDEVDAPLDELNVQRLGKLMQEMSKMVQFLCITHNKMTMELAGQLIGVTMKELGVSRIVAVDIDKALSMSDTN